MVDGAGLGRVDVLSRCIVYSINYNSTVVLPVRGDVRATLPYCSQRDSASYLARLVPLVTSGRLILDG